MANPPDTPENAIPTPEDSLQGSAVRSEPAVRNEPGGARRLPVIRVVGTVLSLGLMVLLVRAQGWEEFGQTLQRLPAQTFWIALGLMFGSRMCVALRWYVLLRFADSRTSFWQTTRLVFMGLFASNFLPTTIGGDLVRMAGAVAQRTDPGVSAASLLLDRLIGMAGMASLAPFGLAVVVRGTAPASVQSAPGVRTLSPASLLMGGMLAGVRELPGLSWMKKKLGTFFSSARHSSRLWLKRPVSLLLALLCTYGHMLFTFLVIFTLLGGFNEPLPLWKIGALWSLSYFITLVPVSINGLGLQELSISLLYSRFGGISTEAGLALALFMRMLPLLASLPGALFLPEILRPFSTPRKPHLPPSRKA